MVEIRTADGEYNGNQNIIYSTEVATGKARGP